VDFAVTVRPLQGLQLGINFSWNGLAEDSTVLSGGQLLFPSGSRIDDSPAITAGAFASYDFPFGGTGWAGQLAASARLHTSLQTTTSVSSGSGLPPVVTESDTITTARHQLYARGSVALARHGLLLRQTWATIAACPWPRRRPSRASVSRPRTSGVQVDYHYK